MGFKTSRKPRRAELSRAATGPLLLRRSFSGLLGCWPSTTSPAPTRQPAAQPCICHPSWHVICWLNCARAAMLLPMTMITRPTLTSRAARGRPGQGQADAAQLCPVAGALPNVHWQLTTTTTTSTTTATNDYTLMAPGGPTKFSLLHDPRSFSAGHCGEQKSRAGGLRAGHVRRLLAFAGWKCSLQNRSGDGRVAAAGLGQAVEQRRLWKKHCSSFFCCQLDVWAGKIREC